MIISPPLTPCNLLGLLDTTKDGNNSHMKVLNLKWVHSWMFHKKCNSPSENLKSMLISLNLLIPELLGLIAKVYKKSEINLNVDHVGLSELLKL